MINEFWEEKYRKDCEKSWNLFYKRNKDKVYKDRRWTDREFEELRKDEAQVLLEIGCGVGNFIMPLLEKYPKLQIYGCDFATEALEILEQKQGFDPNRCFLFPCDITKDIICDSVPQASVDIISCIFVFSALHPKDFKRAASNIISSLKPGGVIIFRDYAMDDSAQKRFKDDRKISERLFVRQDGTFTNYFDTEELKSIFEPLRVLECQVVERMTSNVKEMVQYNRKFIQAKFQKERE